MNPLQRFFSRLIITLSGSDARLEADAHSDATTPEERLTTDFLNDVRRRLHKEAGRETLRSVFPMLEQAPEEHIQALLDHKPTLDDLLGSLVFLNVALPSSFGSWFDQLRQLESASLSHARLAMRLFEHCQSLVKHQDEFWKHDSKLLEKMMPHQALEHILGTHSEGPLSSLECAFLRTAWNKHKIQQDILVHSFIAPWLLSPERNASFQMLVQETLDQLPLSHQQRQDQEQRLEHFPGELLLVCSKTPKNVNDRHAQMLQDFINQGLLGRHLPTFTALTEVGPTIAWISPTNDAHRPFSVLLTPKSELPLRWVMPLAEQIYAALGTAMFQAYASVQEPRADGNKGGNLVQTWLTGFLKNPLADPNTNRTMIMWALEKGYDMHQPMNLSPDSSSSLLSWAIRYQLNHGGKPGATNAMTDEKAATVQFASFLIAHDREQRMKASWESADVSVVEVSESPTPKRGRF